jgi:hypothetical protein
MYPHGDLSSVESRRVRLRERIHLRRRLAVLQVERLAQPVHRLDRARQTWARMAPVTAFALVPLTLFAGRRSRMRRWIGPLLRLAPVALSLFKLSRTKSRPAYHA